MDYFKKMKHGVFCSLVIVGCLSCGGLKHNSGKATMQGTWQSTPIVVDGDSKDWPSPYPNYDAKAMIAYATSNDAQNLYITFETGDPAIQLKILKSGASVTIDTDGKKDGQLSINYPLESENELPEPTKYSEMGKNNKLLEQKIAAGVNGANQFTLAGFGSCNGGYVVTQTAPCGIKVRARIDEYNELVWEAVVPFKVIYNRESLTFADAGRSVFVSP